MSFLRRMKKVLPQAVSEFRDKVQLLQKEKPLASPAHEVIERLLMESQE